MSAPDLIEFEFEAESNRHLMQASLSCITLQSWRAPFSCRTRLSHTCLEKITFDSRKRITLIHKRKHFTAKTTLPARAQSAQGLLTKDRVPQCVGPGKDFNGHHGRHGCLCHHGHHDQLIIMVTMVVMVIRTDKSGRTHRTDRFDI